MELGSHARRSLPDAPSTESSGVHASTPHTPLARRWIYCLLETWEGKREPLPSPMPIRTGFTLAVTHFLGST
ncbi:hypothetical protein RRG08_003042 [Elysia crispata]|uniref:Uncharacterized protein n=1 Tax=Elysia crispata TaxID=231223 RepID=A0AAE1B7H5_9GAST|nr:hypothetical protein RRG08_003042 [Elysia crispata]